MEREQYYSKGVIREGNVSYRSFMGHTDHIVVKTAKEEERKRKRQQSCIERKREGFSCQTANERSYVLAEKMKEFLFLFSGAG